MLADRDKDQLDADVARQLNGSGLHYVTRRGAPHCAKVRAAAQGSQAAWRAAGKPALACGLTSIFSGDGRRGNPAPCGPCLPASCSACCRAPHPPGRTWRRWLPPTPRRSSCCTQTTTQQQVGVACVRLLRSAGCSVQYALHAGLLLLQGHQVSASAAAQQRERL